jgi:glyoxylase-like metal-dependent hydrolase (beta-lactamase superfamily II)
MTRVGVLTVLIVAGALSMTLTAAQQRGQLPRAKVRTIQRVKDNLYFIPGSDQNTYPIPGSRYDASARTATTGGNTAVFVTDGGVVLVDTMNPGSGPEILAQVKSVTTKPVTMIINTHNHFDHTGSNIEFPATVEFVAHENAKANLSKATCPSVTNCGAFQGDNAKFLPKRTFTDRLTLLQGKDRIDLYYFGRGHTNGDTWVVFPALRAMHTGDMFQRKNMPFIDAADNGGNALEFAQTLDRAAATIQGVDTVIPGHSPTLMTWNDFKEYAGYYGDFVAAVRKAIESGKSASDAASAYKPSDRYKAYETDQARITQNAESIHASLKRGR